MSRFFGIVMTIVGVLYIAMALLSLGFVTLDEIDRFYKLTNQFMIVLFVTFWCAFAFRLIYRDMDKIIARRKVAKQPSVGHKSNSPVVDKKEL